MSISGGNKGEQIRDDPYGVWQVAAEDDGVPFKEKMNALTSKLAEQFAKGAELEREIKKNLKGLGFEI